MRTLGTGLMIFGLFAALVALVLLEMVSGAAHLDFMFYAGIALCLAGAILFTARVMLGRRRSSRP